MKNRVIKFRRAHFEDEAKTKFNHFDEWGVGDGTFKSPSSNNFAMYFTDCQFTGLTDKNGKEIYEGDIVRGAHEMHFGRVVYQNGCFCWSYDDRPITIDEDGVWADTATWAIVEGNIYEKPDGELNV